MYFFQNKIKKMKEENNFQKKNQMHSEIDPINNIQAGQEDKHAIINPDSFSYLIPKSDSPLVFKLSEQGNFSLTPIVHVQNYLLICILVESDSFDSDQKLKLTLDSITRNISPLESLGLNASNILITVFVNNLSGHTAEKIGKNLESIDDFLLTPYTYSAGDKLLNVLLITKQNFPSTDLYSLIFFNLVILPQSFIPIQNSVIYTCTLQAGVIPSDQGIKQLIAASYKEVNRSCVCVPSIQSISTGLFGNVMRYEHVHYSIYDLNYFDAAKTLPIDHHFNVMRIDKNLYNAIIQFYQPPRVYNNSSIEYHDFSLGVFLPIQGIMVRYVDKVEAYMNNNVVDYACYMDNYTRKYGGNFAALLELMKTVFNCANCNPISKIILLFEIIGFLFEFIEPSLTCMVAYTIFVEGFKILYKMEPAVFFTGLLGMLFMLSGTISLITKYPQNNRTINFIFYIIFQVYYLFMLIVSVCAMHFVNKNKSMDPYEFNTAALVVIIVINVILGILPMILYLGKIGRNGLNMILYLILGASSSNSHFLMSYLFNFSDMRGGYVTEEKNMKERMNMPKRKGVILLILLLANGLFGFLTLFNNTRGKRVKTVLALSIIFTVYNGIKMIAILIRALSVGGSINRDMNSTNRIGIIRQEIDGTVPRSEDNVAPPNQAGGKTKPEVEVLDDDQEHRRGSTENMRKNGYPNYSEIENPNKAKAYPTNKEEDIKQVSENDIGFDQEVKEINEDDQYDAEEEEPHDDQRKTDGNQVEPIQLEFKQNPTKEENENNGNHNVDDNNNNSGAFQAHNNDSFEI